MRAAASISRGAANAKWISTRKLHIPFSREFTANIGSDSAVPDDTGYNQQSEEFSIPRGDQIISEGDELFLISTAENIKKAVDFLTARKRS